MAQREKRLDGEKATATELQGSAEMVTDGDAEDEADAKAAELELAESRQRAAALAEARQQRHVAFAVWEAGFNQRYSLVAGRYEALLLQRGATAEATGGSLSGHE